MKIQIMGVGAVGTAQAYLASHLGHEVIGYDRSKTSSPYARIVKEPEKEVDITFITTPEGVVESIIDILVQKQVQGIYVIKSTVPSQTTQNLMQKHSIHICHNPEFLREKIALEDVIHPDYVIIGQCCSAHSEILRKFYSPLGCPIAITHPTVSETVKLSINSYLATLITFWNEMDGIARALGISTKEVAGLAKLNSRISSYGTEFFGSPFGGKCLPKDLEQTIQLAHREGANSVVFESIQNYNRKLNADTL